jgi:hypothetical protein
MRLPSKRVIGQTAKKCLLAANSISNGKFGPFTESLKQQRKTCNNENICGKIVSGVTIQALCPVDVRTRQMWCKAQRWNACHQFALFGCEFWKPELRHAHFRERGVCLFVWVFVWGRRETYILDQILVYSCTNCTYILIYTLSSHLYMRVWCRTTLTGANYYSTAVTEEDLILRARVIKRESLCSN